MYFAAAIAIMLSACSIDEGVDIREEGELQTVALSAALPGAESKAVDVPVQIGDDHCLRCKLYVYDTDGGKEIHSEEKLIGEDGVIRFEFSVRKGTDYNCLLWADYISIPESAPADGKYEDKYFDTSDMHAVSFRTDNPASLINNPAVDAFYGAVASDVAMENRLTVVMTRPFAKVNVIEGDTEGGMLPVSGALDISYKVPSGFDIATGKCAGADAGTLSYTDINVEKAAPADASTYFSAYFFIPDVNDSYRMEQGVNSINIKTYDTPDAPTPTHTVELFGLTLRANVEVDGTVSGNSDVVIDGEIDANENLPEIGNIVYADGTWGEEWEPADGRKAIGIVFATGDKAALDESDYGAGMSGKEIYGYAMSLESLTPERYPLFGTSTIWPADWAICWDAEAQVYYEDYSGFGYTGEWLANPTVEGETYSFCLVGKLKELRSTPQAASNLSEWYIPSPLQLKEIAGMAFGFENLEKNEAFAQRYADTEYCDRFSTKSGGVYILSSGIRANGAGAKVYTALIDSAAGSVSSIKENSVSSTTQFNIRPVLTIFEK